jgi:hypothetical protein
MKNTVLFDLGGTLVHPVNYGTGCDLCRGELYGNVE